MICDGEVDLDDTLEAVIRAAKGKSAALLAVLEDGETAGDEPNFGCPNPLNGAVGGKMRFQS